MDARVISECHELSPIIVIVHNTLKYINNLLIFILQISDDVLSMWYDSTNTEIIDKTKHKSRIPPNLCESKSIRLHRY